MAGVVNFRAFWQQPFSAALPPASERRATRLRAHPRAKAVLVFPGALRALQGSFHGLAVKSAKTTRKQCLVNSCS